MAQGERLNRSEPNSDVEWGHIESLLRKNAGNPGALWKTLKSLTNSNIHEEITLDLSGDHTTNPKQVAEEFNEYFINSVNELTNCFESNNDNNDKSQSICQVETHRPTDPFELPIITAEFVKNEIKHLSANKATGNDEISVKIMKLVVGIHVVIDSLTYIILYAIYPYQLRIFLQHGKQLGLSLFLSQAISSK